MSCRSHDGRYHSMASLPSCLRFIDFPRPYATQRRHELPWYTLSPFCLFLSLSLLFSFFFSLYICITQIYIQHTDICDGFTFSINFSPSSRPVSFYQQRQLSRILNRQINRRAHLSILYYSTVINVESWQRTCISRNCFNIFLYTQFVFIFR